ncbi:variable surface protein [Plasmodium gonderi]|uniref:Variable surface protein n=1 Tax=Plasmodium gonderi TaxID=77519 RepID=A0A1Y1JVS5_PLAGO|nr:variable surface protein [Plasmodium gonderi]GAW84463.1 variable surface protein [Plasmodium gonderi]
MGEKIFESLDLYFPEYKKIMDRDYKSYVTYNAYSNQIRAKRGNLKYFDVIEEICDKLVQYLFEIHDEIGNTLRIKKGLLYMYYWLYKNYLISEKDNNYIKEIYNEFINEYYKTDMGKLLKPNPEVNIFDKGWKDMMDICDLNVKLYNIKIKNISFSDINDRCNYAQKCYDLYMQKYNTCEYSSNTLYCNELENIYNLYNSIPNLTINCDKTKYTMLDSLKINKQVVDTHKSSKSVKIIMLTIVILLIPPLLFIIYKFIPYNSHVHCVIRTIKNKYSMMNKEWKMLKPLKIYNRALENSMYNILYNST